MLLIDAHCASPACPGYNLAYVQVHDCPFCHTPLRPDLSAITDATLLRALQHAPSSIAQPLFQMLASSSAYKRLHFISDTLIAGMRLAGGLLIARYTAGAPHTEELDEKVARVITRETHGAWPDLIGDLHDHLTATAPDAWLERYLPLLGKASDTVRREKLFSVENTFTDEYGKSQTVRSQGTPMQLLINFRNRYLGHGTVISEEESGAIYDTYLPIVSRFIAHLAFLQEEEWATDNGHAVSLTGRSSGNYRCGTPGCLLHEQRVGLPVAQACPSCRKPLTLDEEHALDEADERIVREYPYVLAFPYRRALLEQDPYRKLHLLKESFLNYLKYLGLLVASEYFRSGHKHKGFNTNFRELLFRPQFGYWNRFIREGIAQLEELGHTWFVPELPGYYRRIEIAAYERDPQTLTPIGSLIDFRNRHFGHGTVPSDDQCDALWLTYAPVLKELLLQLDFCRRYTMVSYDNLQMWRLMGTEFTPLPADRRSALEDRVQLLDTQGAAMNLVPFFVLPGEFFRQDTASRAKLMVYEQNTGKRIVFFSPESVAGETSGAVLERLNLLLAGKDREEPFTTGTLTAEQLAEAIRRRNTAMRGTLVRERKLLEGIYQPREEAEVALRAWTGARAGLFLVAAEAGSGKTNLLVEMCEQYAAIGIDNLVIRANRMAHADLWTEIRQQLNLADDFALADAEAFRKYSQEQPLIVLIDGGNEHPRPSALLEGVLRFLDVHRGGHIKVVLTWRVSSKSELPAVEKRHEDLVYADNLEGRDENILARYCHWLKPLNRGELEGAWDFYVTRNAKTHKPRFTLDDLTDFDRALTDQLRNPLLLRLFLELFHGKSLPKNAGVIDIWGLYHERLVAA